MPSGGARPGAGRPRKREKYARPIAQAEKRIADNLPNIIDKLMELADGVTVQETGKDGSERIYDRPPDREAAKYLIDRIMGKPTERQEVDNSGDLVIRVHYAEQEHRVNDTEAAHVADGSNSAGEPV